MAESPQDKNTGKFVEEKHQKVYKIKTLKRLQMKKYQKVWKTSMLESLKQRNARKLAKEKLDSSEKKTLDQSLTSFGICKI